MKLILIICALVLVSCSAKKEEPTGVIPKAQLEALEKAKEVEDVLKKQEEATRKKLEGMK